MPDIDEFLKLMESSGEIDEAELSRLRKEHFDPIVRDQCVFEASRAFVGESFDLPRRFSRYSFALGKPVSGRLPEFLKEFMWEMDDVSFGKMLPSTRRVIWLGVRLGLGLSESDFPYPERLKELDEAEPSFFSSHSSPNPLPIVLVLSFLGGFLSGGFVVHKFTPAISHESSPHVRSSPLNNFFPGGTK